MARLLYITCNLEPVKLSRGLTVGSEFINEYQRCNPGDEIHFLDLYRDNIQRLAVCHNHVADGGVVYCRFQ